MEHLSFKGLIDKSEDELRKIKLAKEIESFYETKNFERRKYKNETIRVFILSIISAIIALGSNYIFKSWDQKNSLSAETRKEVSEYLKQFSLTKDSSIKINMACLIGEIDNPGRDGYVEFQKKNFYIICKSQNGIQQELAKINLITATDTSSLANKENITHYADITNTNDSLQNRKKVLQNKKDIIKIDSTIAFNTKQLNLLVAQSPEIKSIITSNDKINENVKNQIDATEKVSTSNQTNNIQKNFGVPWFKDGYFLQFDDMRVLLQYLDKRLGIQVEVCQTTSSARCDNPIKTKAWISYDRPLTVKVGDFNYQISLKAIDHAGNNPFKLAAYINVVKLTN